MFDLSSKQAKIVFGLATLAIGFFCSSRSIGW